MSAGRMPSRTSVRPNFASSLATAMSHAQAKPTPPPYTAMEASDHRLREVAERREHVPELLGFAQVLLEARARRRLHGADVGARTERRPAPAQHHDAHRIIVGQNVKHDRQLGPEIGVDRVVRFRRCTLRAVRPGVRVQ